MAESALILASTSATRQKLLRDAGLTFISRKPALDEASLQWKLQGEAPKALALSLAAAKALSLSAPRNGDVIIGADQVLEVGGRVLHKARSLAEARSHLESLIGQTHQLHSAVACAQGGAIVFEHTQTAHLTMRKASPLFLESYLTQMGAKALHTVGCYEYEGLGAQLFEKVEGDFHTIMGLPLLPLLAFLRKRAIISS